ncbi:hypothetical protein QBC40DRAFT_321490 [Triangularia verruculosa]|uniref:Uncharacterized protein n=1 Tax=Triangularia verruculosa TaxID=2587418 RepID=A0AAN6XLN0_9PEZI|nr:hypothetical protein QBC40DRAFT_321490 [Triangularia verruculosa]
MAWDSKATRRRQSSAASRTRDIAIHARNQSRQPTQPLSDHVADPFLTDFLVPSFDPASYLNSTLPPLQTSKSNPQPNSLPLSDLSITAQSTLSQLNAHTTRLTAVLTQLTDDIIRSGSRLAYEVEVLRGETISLSETLAETLDSDINQFIPGGIKPILSSSSSSADPAPRTRALSSLPVPLPQPTPPPQTPEVSDPPPISHLRTLTLVKSRLSQTQSTFGAAMSFVFPPSETSVSSSFLSVSAPDSSHVLSTEEKGQQVLSELKQEIVDLLENNKEDPIKGIEDAARRVEELKDLCLVWKGTAEEKGRVRFVEGLARLVEERHERLLREMNGGGGQGNGREGGNLVKKQEEDRDDGGCRNGNAAAAAAGGGTGAGSGGGGGYGGYGLISQLQKLRGGM